MSAVDVPRGQERGRLPSGSDRDRAAALVLLAALAAGLLGQGAFFWPMRWELGLLVCVSASLALGRGRRGLLGSLAAPVVAACALAGWAVVDGALHGSVLAGAQPALLLLACLVVLVVCHRLSATGREILLSGSLAVGLVLAGTGWLGVVLHRPRWAMVAEGLWRASSAITYPNATAAVLACLALAALAQLVERPRSAALRLTATGLLAGLICTESRAGLLSLAVGLLLLALLLGARALLRAVLGPALGSVIAFVGTLPSVPETSRPGPVPAVLALLLGLAVPVAVGRVTPRVAMSGVIAAAAGLCVLAGPAFGTSVASTASHRLTLSSPDRSAAMRAAVDLVGTAPLTGSGPGAARLRWTGADGTPREIRFAHNEYLQTAAELGLLGTALLLLVLIAVVRLLHRSRHAASRSTWAGLTAGLAALATHSALDFLWHLTAVPLLAAAFIGLATARPGQPVPTLTPEEEPCVPSPANSR